MKTKLLSYDVNEFIYWHIIVSTLYRCQGVGYPILGFSIPSSDLFLQFALLYDMENITSFDYLDEDIADSEQSVNADDKDTYRPTTKRKICERCR